MSDNVLDELFVKEDEAVDISLLKDLLKDYVQLTVEGKVIPLPEYGKLNTTNKILIYLLAKKALSIKTDHDEATSPKEIQDAIGLSRGSTNPTLRRLETEKRYIVSKKSKYYIPNYMLHKIKEVLSK